MLLALSLLLAMASLGYVGAAIAALLAWKRRPEALPAATPPVTILKPLCGAEPELADNLKTFLDQDYPAFQVVFGARRADDPGLAAAAALSPGAPGCATAFVANDAAHGANGKISNLINMLPAARHDILVIADSDIAVPPGYLRSVVSRLADPRTGAVTALYGADPARKTWAGRLACLHLNSGFLPAVVLARRIGKTDFCLGATMAVRREALEAIGGLEALAPFLADDYMLGRLLTRKGYRIAMLEAPVRTSVAETRLKAVLRHELRWARTVRTAQPLGYAWSFLMYPVPLGALAALAALFTSGWGAPAALLLLGAGGAARLALHETAARRLGLPRGGLRDIVLLPLRDVLSLYVWMRGLFGQSVLWRGEPLRVNSSGLLTQSQGNSVR